MHLLRDIHRSVFYDKGYSPIRAFVQDGVVPENLAFRPQQLPPEHRVNTNSESYNNNNNQVYFKPSHKTRRKTHTFKTTLTK